MWSSNNFKRVPVKDASKEPGKVHEIPVNVIPKKETPDEKVLDKNLDHAYYWTDSFIDGIFIYGYVAMSYVFRYLWVVALLIFIIVIAFFMPGIETAAEKSERIRNEIQVLKDINIEKAETMSTKLYVDKENLITKLADVDKQLFLYDKCIERNKIEELPVSCENVTVSLKETLWWKVNKDWLSQAYLDLIWDTPKQRASHLLSHYPTVSWHLDFFIEMWHKYNIDPYLVIAIAKADSWLGNELKTANNIGNVGNNDRWDTVSFATLQAGIEAMYQTLNNQYLWSIYSVWYLSCWGKAELGVTDCFQNDEKVYATSDSSWNANVINTMRNIYADGTIDETYNFRR